ncbi:MAG: HEAT repeat domain-containing protein [Solirubrobacterales bacterium]
MRHIDDLVSALDEAKARSALRRVWLVNALGRLGDSKAVEPLAQVVSTDPSSQVRLMAVIALGQIGDPAGAPVVRKEASSRGATDQMYAIQALARMRDHGSVPLLIERLRSANRSVRVFAADALGEIGDAAATLPLIEALGDPYVRRAAAVALANLGDPRALEPVRLAHQAAGGFARRRIGRALVKLEANSDGQERDGDETSSGGLRELLALALERWLLPFVLMAATVWDAFKIKSKKQRLAEAIEQGRRLLTARDDRATFEFLQRAVCEFPEDPQIRLLYAAALLEFRPNDVGREAVKAVELGIDDPGSLVRAACLLGFAGQWDEARSCVARANELAEPGFALKAGLDNLNGILAAQDHEFDRAEELLRSATEEDPLNAYDLAKFLAWRDREPEALEVIDEALKHVKNRFSLEYLRGKIVDGSFMAD